MTDEMTDLVDDALADADRAAAEDASAAHPEIVIRPEFVSFPLDDFVSAKGLWAANYYVLWPLGMTLTVDVASVPDDPADPAGPSHPEYSNLSLREWRYQDGEAGETINNSDEENELAYRHFLLLCQRRILAMKPSERRLAISRLGYHKLATAESILAVGS